MNTSQIRDEARAKATKPFITNEMVDALIERTEFWKVPGLPMTVCCLVLKNGYAVTDSASCMNAENYNEELQKKLSYSKARDHIFKLLAFHKMALDHEQP